MKKYLANTTISVSVSLQNGGNARVSFSPLTDGSSVFYTDDKELQYALEHHYKFGKLFSLAGESQEETAPAAKKAAKSPAKKNAKTSKNAKPEQPTPEEESEESPATDETESEEDQEETEQKEVEVSDIDAAKDYLAENFDVVRTKLKTEEIINETALSFGITFKYL